MSRSAWATKRREAVWGWLTEAGGLGTGSRRPGPETVRSQPRRAEPGLCRSHYACFRPNLTLPACTGVYNGTNSGVRDEEGTEILPEGCRARAAGGRRAV